MKSRFFAMLVLLAVAFLCLIVITACTKPHVHEFSEWQVVTNATCTENGKEKHTCAACGYFASPCASERIFVFMAYSPSERSTL